MADITEHIKLAQKCCMILYTQSNRNLFTRSHPSEGENRTRNYSKNCKSKRTYIELDLPQNFEAPTFSMLFFYVIRRVSFIYSVVFWKRMIRLIFLR